MAVLLFSDCLWILDVCGYKVVANFDYFIYQFFEVSFCCSVVCDASAEDVFSMDLCARRC